MIRCCQPHDKKKKVQISLGDQERKRKMDIGILRALFLLRLSVQAEADILKTDLGWVGGGKAPPPNPAARFSDPSKTFHTD